MTIEALSEHRGVSCYPLFLGALSGVFYLAFSHPAFRSYLEPLPTSCPHLFAVFPHLPMPRRIDFAPGSTAAGAPGGDDDRERDGGRGCGGGKGRPLPVPAPVPRSGWIELMQFCKCAILLPMFS